MASKVQKTPKARSNQRAFERDILSGNGKRVTRSSRDKKLNANLKRFDNQYKQAVSQAASTEYLLPESSGYLEAENDLEKTFKVRQKELKENVDISTANKALHLSLKEFGPYHINYSRNGTHMLITGRKGHVASMDWRKGALRAELYLNETCSAATYLQNEQYFAVAQKKYTFIYDDTGTELHRLKQHVEARHLEFLPYHYLLVSSGETGWLKYHDVSTGQLVGEHRTKLGPTTTMAQNPWNAVIHLGHYNGTVTLWSPSMSQPLVKLLSARGPINSIAIDRSGRYMVTAGRDKSLKIWDIRTFKELHYIKTLPSVGTDVTISDTGILALARGPHLTMWKDALRSSSEAIPRFFSNGDPSKNAPYMSHLFEGDPINNMKFVPFEDFLGVGHEFGVTHLIVPGAGEANYDALEINPYESARQRQEQEVRLLLNKLPADSITLDPNVIGTVSERASSVRLTKKQLAAVTDQNGDESKEGDVVSTDDKLASKKKSKDKGLRGYLRKKAKNVIDERKLRIERQLEKERLAREQERRRRKGELDEVKSDPVDAALSRFSK